MIIIYLPSVYISFSKLSQSLLSKYFSELSIDILVTSLLLSSPKKLVDLIINILLHYDKERYNKFCIFT